MHRVGVLNVSSNLARHGRPQVMLRNMDGRLSPSKPPNSPQPTKPKPPPAPPVIKLTVESDTAAESEAQDVVGELPSTHFFIKEDRLAPVVSSSATFGVNHYFDPLAA